MVEVCIILSVQAGMVHDSGDQQSACKPLDQAVCMTQKVKSDSASKRSTRMQDLTRMVQHQGCSGWMTVIMLEDMKSTRGINLPKSCQNALFRRSISTQVLIQCAPRHQCVCSHSKSRPGLPLLAPHTLCTTNSKYGAFGQYWFSTPP